MDTTLDLTFLRLARHFLNQYYLPTGLPDDCVPFEAELVLNIPQEQLPDKYLGSDECLYARAITNILSFVKLSPYGTTSTDSEPNNKQLSYFDKLYAHNDVPNALCVLSMALAYHASQVQEFAAYASASAVMSQLDILKNNLAQHGHCLSFD